MQWWACPSADLELQDGSEWNDNLGALDWNPFWQCPFWTAYLTTSFSFEKSWQNVFKMETMIIKRDLSPGKWDSMNSDDELQTRIGEKLLNFKRKPLEKLQVWTCLKTFMIECHMDISCIM